MKIAVIDCSVSGHRETYYKQFARIWAALGHDVLLLAPDGEGTDSCVSFRQIASRPLLPLPCGQPLKKKATVLRNALIRLQNLASLRKQLKGYQPDLVCFPCLDDMLPTLSPVWLLNKLVPYKWCGLFVQSVQPVYKRYMPDIRPALRSRRCKGVGVLNEYSVEALKPFRQEIYLFPDFADLSAPEETYTLLHTLRKRAAGRHIISLLGSVNARKGTGLLLDTIPMLPADKYFFLIAGKPSLSPEETNQLRDFEAAHPNCLFALEKIPDEGCFNALVAESSLIFAAYRQFSGSSNLLTKAAAFSKPVVVSKGFCMGQRVETYGTGLAIPENDTEACRAAIIQLCNEGAPSPQGFSRYTTDHSVGKLTECFNQIICQLQ